MTVVEMVTQRLGNLYHMLVNGFEMHIKLRNYAIHWRSLSARNLNDTINEFNLEVNRMVIDVVGRSIDRLYTTIEPPDRSRRPQTCLVTYVSVGSTAWEFKIGLQKTHNWGTVASLILGPNLQSAALHSTRPGQPYYASGAIRVTRGSAASSFWERSLEQDTVRDLVEFRNEVMDRFIVDDPLPRLMVRKCTSCKTTDADLSSEWCQTCSARLRPLKDAVNWLVMTITSIANAMALGMAAGLSMSPLYVATRKRYFGVSEVWQKHVTGLIQNRWLMCAYHGLVPAHHITCQPCAVEKAKHEQLELIMSWLDKVCRVIARLVWEQVPVSVGRRMMLELEATKVIAEDEHDNTRYALLELS